MRNIPIDNLSYGLLIEITGGGSGSGYFVNADDKMFLVTAKHVLFNKNGDLRGDTANILGYTKLKFRTLDFSHYSYYGMRTNRIRGYYVCPFCVMPL